MYFNLLIMACLNPLRILSPESRFLNKCRRERRPFEYYIQHCNDRRNPIADPYPLCETPYDYYNFGTFHPERRYMIVPCGKCENCRKAVTDGYFVRCYFEWQETLFEHQGSVYFITLTYGDDMLPRLSDGTPCFSKRHVQLFLKRLAKYEEFHFKYFIVSEFGGEFGRPHYHGLLFIPGLPPTVESQFKVLEAVANAWTKQVDRRKEYCSMANLGLFDLQRVDVQLLQDLKQVRYVAKYVGKQVGADAFDARKDIDGDNKRFHLQSIGLGECYYKYCNRDVWEKGRIEIDGYGYQIPMYYRNRIFREYYCIHENGSVIYQPTDFKYQYIAALSRRQFQVHKDMSILNADYPTPPAWSFDPECLAKVFRFFDTYVVFRMPLPDDEFEVKMYLDEWSEYLERVQKYNHSKYLAQAAKIKKQREDHYNKKTGRK